MLSVWWERAFARKEGEIELEGTEVVKYLQSFGCILVPHSTVNVLRDQILANMSMLVGDWHSVISGQTISRPWFDRLAA